MTRPLRIAVVARAVWPLHGAGGLERSVFDLVTQLTRKDVSITLITPPARDPAGVEAFDRRRVTHRPVPYVTFPGANRRGTTILDRSTAYLVFGARAGRLALSLARSGDVDLVHGFGASVLGFARARPPAPVPLVLNPQGLEEFGATSRQGRLKAIGYLPLQRAVRACARAASSIIATDRSLESTVDRHLHPRPGQMRTIPNGIDVEAIDALASAADVARVRREAGIKSADLVFLSVGRLEGNKGFDDLAAALGRLARPGGALQGRNWRWVLAGEGPARQTIESAIARVRLGAHVLMPGRLSDRDLHAWYEAATLFVHPTRYEGSSIVTLEAMAHRRPVVATRAGGLADKVFPGTNGWLAPPGDADALAHALEDAVAGPARLPVMGQAGRALVEREFAWSVLVDRWMALYHELIGRDASRPEIRIHP